MSEVRVCTGGSSGDPYISQYLVRLQHCHFALEQILHIFPTELDLSPSVALRCELFFFVTRDKTSETFQKVHLPQRTISLYPICYISNPLQRMWCLHLPWLSLPYVELFERVTGGGRYREFKSVDSNAVCWVSSLWIQFFASRWDGLNLPDVRVRRHPVFSLTCNSLYMGTSS